jgi:transposase
MLRYMNSWIDQLRWQRLKPMEKLANMLVNHLEGILNYCRTKVKLGVVEALNGNIKALLRRGRGYRNLNYLLLKAQRMAATRTEFAACQKAAQNAHFPSFLPRANNKIRVVTRRSYGFRTFKAMEMAMYHTLGRLPEPETAHRFC